MDIGLPVDDDISILLEGLKETLPRDKYKVVQAATMAPKTKVAMAIPAIPPSDKLSLEELEGQVLDAEFFTPCNNLSGISHTLKIVRSFADAIGA